VFQFYAVRQKDFWHSKPVNTILLRTHKLRLYKYTSGYVCLPAKLNWNVDKRSN